MSWYASEMVTCCGCGARFDTPIERLEHGRLCRWKTTRYGNGSFERNEFDSGHRFLSAPSGFGGNWKVKLNGFTTPRDVPVRIKRKGKLWEAAFVDGTGFTWTAVRKSSVDQS